jgi:hypothetical protein
MSGVQLSESTLSSRQAGVRLNVEKPKPFDPGPQGGFQFGTSSDLTRVLIIAHVPQVGAVDLLISLEDARAMLAGLSRVITLVASQP